MKTPHIFTIAFLSLCITQPAFSVSAASLFEKYTLEGHAGEYLVKKKNVNVRQKPSNKGKRLTELNRRDKIDVLGLAKGTQWAAVKQDGKELGFVYVFSITPIIDASFSNDIKGEIDLSEQDKPNCSYTVSFEGRFEEEEVVFVSSDYLARFNCEKDNDVFDFTAMMFMSEVPHDLGMNPVYQITMNLPEIATGYEEFLSATSLYHQRDDKVVMDAVSLKAYKEKDLRKSMPAKTVEEAIVSAITLQLQSFNTKAWRTISGDLPSPGVAEPD